VREWRRGTTPLLLLHGFMGSAEEWGDLPEGLEGMWVAAVDLPGHGRSEGEPSPERYRVPRIAREMGRLQEVLFGEPAAWLGYSMGGRIALSAAAQGVPMRMLLLESASPGLQDPAARQARRERDEETAQRLVKEGMSRFVDHWLGLPLFQGLRRVPEEPREHARRIRSAQDPAQMAAWLRGGGTGTQPSYWDDLHQLRVPVRLLAGEADEKFRDLAVRMAALLPDARLTLLRGAGHLPHLETPEAWVDWIRSAL
jgi:2-succinyl-6-hydroxy-2,4-cyclohexadiene-1-carboxylate synthase